MLNELKSSYPSASNGQIVTYNNLAWVYTDKGWALMEYKGSLNKAYKAFKDSKRTQKDGKKGMFPCRALSSGPYA